MEDASITALPAGSQEPTYRCAACGQMTAGQSRGDGRWRCTVCGAFGDRPKHDAEVTLAPGRKVRFCPACNRLNVFQDLGAGLACTACGTSSDIRVDDTDGGRPGDEAEVSPTAPTGVRQHPQAYRLRAVALLCVLLAAGAILMAGIIDGNVTDAGSPIDAGSLNAIVGFLVVIVGPVLLGAGLALGVAGVVPSLSRLASLCTSIGSMTLALGVGLILAFGDFIGGFLQEPCGTGELPS